MNEEYSRVEGLTVPWPLPGKNVLDPVHETHVTVTMEIEGNGLSEGQKITVVTQKLRLPEFGAMILDVVQKDSRSLDDISYDAYVRELMDPERRLNLAIQMAVPTEPGLPFYTVKLPDES